MRIFRIEIGRALVRVNRVLGALQLVVHPSQRELHLRRALGDGHSLDDFRSVRKVAILRIETREIEDDFFGIRIEILGEP